MHEANYEFLEFRIPKGYLLELPDGFIENMKKDFSGLKISLYKTIKLSFKRSYFNIPLEDLEKMGAGTIRGTN